MLTLTSFGNTKTKRVRLFMTNTDHLPIDLGLKMITRQPSHSAILQTFAVFAQKMGKPFERNIENV